MQIRQIARWEMRFRRNSDTEYILPPFSRETTSLSLAVCRNASDELGLRPAPVSTPIALLDFSSLHGREPVIAGDVHFHQIFHVSFFVEDEPDAPGAETGECIFRLGRKLVFGLSNHGRE